MYDFKPGDKVQVDPALVNSKVRQSQGIGIVVETRCGYTETQVRWPNTIGYGEWHKTCDLVPVAQMRETEL